VCEFWIVEEEYDMRLGLNGTVPTQYIPQIQNLEKGFSSWIVEETNAGVVSWTK